MDETTTPEADLAAEARLLARLAELGIATTTARHPPVATVAEAQALRGSLPGGHCKCLFLKSKRGEHVLAVVREELRVDLTALARQLGLGRFSFASAARLEEWLGVRAGAVTPFALINAGGRPLTVVLERAMLACAPLNYHPLHNRATTAIQPDDLCRFVVACGYRPLVIDFSAPIVENGSTKAGIDPI